MSVPSSPFGLYPSRNRVAAQRVMSGTAFTLGQPVVEGGVSLFRQSLWLAVPVAALLAIVLLTTLVGRLVNIIHGLWAKKKAGN